MESLVGTPAVLGKLTASEREQWTAKLWRALRRTNDELEELERCAPAIRQLLYGPSALEMTQGMRNDLIDILADDLAPVPVTTISES